MRLPTAAIHLRCLRYLFPLFALRRRITDNDLRLAAASQWRFVDVRGVHRFEFLSLLFASVRFCPEESRCLARLTVVAEDALRFRCSVVKSHSSLWQCNGKEDRERERERVREGVREKEKWKMTLPDNAFLWSESAVCRCWDSRFGGCIYVDGVVK